MCKKTTLLALTLLALLGVVPLLTACHTTAGAGQDISNTGKAIQNSANQHAP
jgi:predicted small secreted protein